MRPGAIPTVADGRGRTLRSVPRPVSAELLACCGHPSNLTRGLRHERGYPYSVATANTRIVALSGEWLGVTATARTGLCRTVYLAGKSTRG